jgi:hypothetical protein
LVPPLGNRYVYRRRKYIDGAASVGKWRHCWKDRPREEMRTFMRLLWPKNHATREYPQRDYGCV